MLFMAVIRKGEIIPCAYFIDGKRVSREYYELQELLTIREDTYYSRETAHTWQHCHYGYRE